MSSGPKAAARQNIAKARAVLEELPPDELRSRKQRAAIASGDARRQQRDETIIIKIQPAHKLTPEQVSAWRALWSLILTPEAVPDDAA